MPANPLFSRAHSTFYQHVLSTLKVVQKKIKPPSALYLSGLKTVFINTFCPISLITHPACGANSPDRRGVFFWHKKGVRIFASFACLRRVALAALFHKKKRRRSPASRKTAPSLGFQVIITVAYITLLREA